MREERVRNNYFLTKLIGKVFFAIIIVVSMILFQNVARAEEYLLKCTSKIIYVGDSFEISNYFSEKEIKEVKYSLADNSVGTGYITLDAESGKISALSEGTAVVNVTYILEEDSVTRTESFTVTVSKHELITSSYGSLVQWNAFVAYSPDEYTYSFSNNSVAISKEDGFLQIQGFEGCEVSVLVEDRKIHVADIMIAIPDFQGGSQLTRAIGTQTYLPAFVNYTPIEDEGVAVWSSENEEIASVSEDGISPVSLGTTRISAMLTAKNGETITISAGLTITDPQISQTVYTVARGVKKTITATGVCEYSTYECDANDLNAAYFVDKNKLYGNYKGTAQLTLVVDGKAFALKVIVTNPKYSKNKFTLYKGQKKQFSLSGLNKTYSTVSYSISNKKIATVSSAGKVKAKKTGVAKIKAKADGKTITVWIEVCTKKAYRASKKGIAISKTKTRYSQIKRMRKGYYDCSSLVSRVYRKYGVYFGSKKGWSPTAAGIGQWCAKHKKVIARKGVSYNKLVPGDLIFYSYTRNGRYKNISHIEIYVGNGKSISASSSYNRVVHYNYKKSSVVMIARPTK